MSGIDPIVSTIYPVTGLRGDDDVKKALQELYDVFADLGLGQATFELTPEQQRLIVKHKASVQPDAAAIDAALRRAGDFSLLAE